MDEKRCGDWGQTGGEMGGGNGWGRWVGREMGGSYSN